MERVFANFIEYLLVMFFSVSRAVEPMSVAESTEHELQHEEDRQYSTEREARRHVPATVGRRGVEGWRRRRAIDWSRQDAAPEGREQPQPTPSMTWGCASGISKLTQFASPNFAPYIDIR
jgi:hypothetical protein